ncbi:hypothetical protein Ae717Ps2_5838 [Pseudonocardia sp. Ae717_Ps2]|nr:hypothetical protein Ae717Ps2_5838 [Pseudonocardia sp. Ae717_Ps2]
MAPKRGELNRSALAGRLSEPFSTWRLCWSSRRVGLPGPRPRGGLTCIIGDLAAADGAPAAASRRVLGQVEKGSVESFADAPQSVGSKGECQGRCGVFRRRHQSIAFTSGPDGPGHLDINLTVGARRLGRNHCADLADRGAAPVSDQLLPARPCRGGLRGGGVVLRGGSGQYRGDPLGPGDRPRIGEVHRPGGLQPTACGRQRVTVRDCVGAGGLWDSSGPLVGCSRVGVLARHARRVHAAGEHAADDAHTYPSSEIAPTQRRVLRAGLTQGHLDPLTARVLPCRLKRYDM